VDETAIAHIQAYMGHGPAAIGKGQEVTGPQSIQLSVHFGAFTSLISASAGQRNPVLGIGVLNQTRAIKPFSILTGSAELVGSAHRLCSSCYD
jgi:hypothetical protein